MTAKGTDVSRREHLLAAGYDEDDLITSEFPAVFFDVWEWYRDLSLTRKNNGYSMLPIEYTEIKSYFELRKLSPDWWQIDIIRRLDYLSLKLNSENK